MGLTLGKGNLTDVDCLGFLFMALHACIHPLFCLPLLQSKPLVACWGPGEATLVYACRASSGHLVLLSWTFLAQKWGQHFLVAAGLLCVGLYVKQGAPEVNELENKSVSFWFTPLTRFLEKIVFKCLCSWCPFVLFWEDCTQQSQKAE